jgi:hypothetical protein
MTRFTKNRFEPNSTSGSVGYIGSSFKYNDGWSAKLITRLDLVLQL